MKRQPKSSNVNPASSPTELEMATLPSSKAGLPTDTQSVSPKSDTFLVDRIRAYSSMPSTTSNTPAISTPVADGDRGVVPKNLDSFEELSLLAEQIRKLDLELSKIHARVAERTASIVSEDYFEHLPNDTMRRAYIDEYLGYDNLIEDPLRLRAERGYLDRLYTIRLKQLDYETDAC